MDVFDEELAVSGLVGGLRGACGHAGYGPATQHRARPATAHREPGGLLVGTCNQPSQQQMQDDYATQLRQAQHDMLVQNPSGLTRPELSISRALNGFTTQ